MLAKIPILETCPSLDSIEYDGIIVIASKIQNIQNDDVRKPLEDFCKLDFSAVEGCLVASELPSRKIIFSGTGPLDRDYDDVRR